MCKDTIDTILVKPQLLFLDFFLSYFLLTKDPAGKRRKREDEFDDISLKNRPEKELTCKFRTRMKIIFDEKYILLRAKNSDIHP